MNISFQNILPETPEQIIPEFLEMHADIEGSPFQVRKIYNSIEFCTGTRVYQVTRLYQHIPRRLPNMFGRSVVSIYDKQPEQKEYQQQQKQQQNTYNKSTDNIPPMTQTVTTSTHMKKQINHGKYTEDDKIDNIKNKTKKRTKMLAKDKRDKIIITKYAQWTINHPKTINKTIQTSKIQPTKN